MNRMERRAAAKRAGLDFAAEQRAKREAAAAEAIALRMSPAEAREQLARWAAQTGRRQDEVDAMNATSFGP